MSNNAVTQDQKNILLIIRQREKVLFEGVVKAFTSLNERGVFDVICEHANFISLINKNCTIHKLDGSSTDMRIEEGIVRVYENRVMVYLGIMG